MGENASKQAQDNDDNQNNKEEEKQNQYSGMNEDTID